MSKPVICIGASFIDELFHAKEEMLLATTNDAVVTKTAGGVSRNIAHQLSLLNVPVQLISVFGNDSDGDWLRQVCTQAGVKLDASIIKEGLSGKYTGILNVDGSLFSAFLTNAANHLITPEHLSNYKDLLHTASYILADANINVDTAAWLLSLSRETGIPFVIEPVSVPPAKKFRNVDLNGLYLITPNEDELPVLCDEKDFFTQQQIEALLHKGIQHIWLHNGKHGSALYSNEKSITLHAPEIEVVDCTGAGDGSLSGFILGRYLGKNDMDCLKLAHTLSAEILQVNGAIATHLTQDKLIQLVTKILPRLMNALLEIQPEVKEALQNGTPVVALESTIISHGMPYPKNVETAIAVEEVVRANGAVPATIALFNGKCHVGLSKEQLEYFGNAKDVWKVSLRDMPFVLSKNLYGATTVAATMRIAAMAGIKVFVTGGIGGVHRGAETSMDISADLTEMAETSVAVVSAGVKSILDIGLTLEYLETKGIPVVSLGQDEFPSFYSKKSGFASPLRLDTANEVAMLMNTKWNLGLNGAVLIANPIPAENEIATDEMEIHIQSALQAAAEKNITGKEVTPFILQYIATHSNGESLEANIALIKHNAKAGALIAVAYEGLK